MSSKQPYRPRTLAFSFYLRLLIKLRWIAILVSIAVVAVSQFIFKFPMGYKSCYALIGVILIYNTAFYAYVERKAHLGELHGFSDSKWLRSTRLAALLQILFDVFALFGLLHFSGGIENPFILFFLFHVVIAAILLETFHALILSALVVVLIFALGILEKTGIFFHYHNDQLMGSFEFFDKWLFVLGIPATLSVTIFILCGQSILIMNERGRRRDQILEFTDELNRKNRKLLRMDQMRKHLMAVASHDLKSPVAAVSSYLMSLRAGYIGKITDEQSRVIDRSLTRLDRLKDFISDVLDWSTIERGELRQKMQNVQLCDVLRRVIDDYQDLAKSKNIEIKEEIEQDIPDVVASLERMAQVFDNLMSNAIKYTLDDGTVTISAKSLDNNILFSISDTGIGMSPKDLEHLFEDFYRSDDVKKQFEGTGLGLSVVHRIVNAHNGRVWAESKKETGTSFFVSLPLERKK